MIKNIVNLDTFDMHDGVSIVIPGYNEAQSIGATLDELLAFLQSQTWPWQVIVVNDGSSDQTAQILESYKDRVLVISHRRNLGQGAAIKSGIQAATHPWVLLYDADGQHQPANITAVMAVSAVRPVDLVIGARQTDAQSPWQRRPGKRMMKWIAEYLVGHAIPDLNSGLRLFRRQRMADLLPYFPERFSFSTVQTIASLKEGLEVEFAPITIRERSGGTSSVSLRDGLQAIMRILRIVMVFDPLRVFLTISGWLGALALLSLLVDLMRFNIGDTTVLLFVVCLLIFLFGLLADQVAAMRRELRR